MRIRTGIHYLSFHKSPGLAKELYSIYESVPESHDGDNFFSVVEGSEVFSVIFSRDFYGALESVRERHTPDIEEGDLAVLTIRISSRYVGQKGIVYFITKQLSFFGVNIVELHTSKTELTLLIQDEDKKKAISILG